MFTYLMSRFREEWYATRRYKALTRRKDRTEIIAEGDSRARRSQYLSQSLPVRKAIHKAQTARLDGFE